MNSEENILESNNSGLPLRTMMSSVRVDFNEKPINQSQEYIERITTRINLEDYGFIKIEKAISNKKMSMVVVSLGPEI